jgi:hypothetical protein
MPVSSSKLISGVVVGVATLAAWEFAVKPALENLTGQQRS